VCSLCVKSRQTCFYREGPLKPGPKLGMFWLPTLIRAADFVTGSKQGHRKRARAGEARSASGEAEDGQGNDCAGRLKLSDTSRAATSQNMNGQYGQETGLLPGCNFNCGPALRSPACATPRPESLDMNDLSSIVHPSHEPTFDIYEIATREGPPNPAETMGQSSSPDMISPACKTLCISSETLNAL
jgi:hypothetical protein